MSRLHERRAASDEEALALVRAALETAHSREFKELVAASAASLQIVKDELSEEDTKLSTNKQHTLSLRRGHSGVQISRYWVRVRGFREAGGGEQSNYGLTDWPVASAYGPSTEGAGTRVCGYAIKNSGLTVV